MSDDKPDNVIRFPGVGRVTSQPQSPAEAFLEAMRTIDAEPKKAKRSRKKVEPTQTIDGDNNTQIGASKVSKQSIQGSGNTQIAGGVQSLTIKTGKAKVELAPPPGSIGASAVLRSRIEALIKEVNEYRYKRLGKAFKFGALYGELAKAFGLKASEWRSIWLWDEFRADEVVAWLESKRDNTQQGRINKAAKGEGFQHSRGHLFRLEKQYVEQLEWPEDVTRKRLQLVTSHTSRADLSAAEFNNWVAYLRREVEAMYGETNN